MKIKISYTQNEIVQANEIEFILRNFFKSEKNIKVRKPENREAFHHTYMTIGKV